MREYDSTRHVDKLIGIRRHLNVYRELGFLTDEVADEVQAHLDRVDESDQVAMNYDQTLAKYAEGAATGVSPLEVAMTLPAREAVYAVAQAQHDNAALSAWRILRENRPIDQINALFKSLHEEATAAGEAVRHLTNAQDAIDSGLVAEWQTFVEATDRYAALVQLTGRLRADKLLPGPRLPGDGGWHWWQRNLPADSRADLSEHAARYAMLAADSYVPRDQAEADATLAAAQPKRTATSDDDDDDASWFVVA